MDIDILFNYLSFNSLFDCWDYDGYSGSQTL